MIGKITWFYPKKGFWFEIETLELNRLKPVVDARNSQITYKKRWADLSKTKIKPKEVWD